VVSVLAIAGVVVVAAFAWLVVASRSAMDARERRALAWLVPGALGALFIVAGTGIPGGRLLVVPDLGIAAGIGVVIRWGLPLRGGGGWSLRLGCIVLSALHFVLGPVLALRETRAIGRRAKAAEAMAEDVEGGLRGSRAAFVIASDPLALVYAKAVRADVSDRRVCWSALAGARTDYRLTRTSERTFVLDALSGPVVGGFFERLFRADDAPLGVGQEVEQCGATIRVAGAERGRPTRLEVETRRDLDASALFAWRGGHLQRVEFPGVGDAMELPWEAGPTERARWSGR
jgi:hypothetical protein